MRATTPRLGLPLIDGSTDPVSDGDDTLNDLANRLDAIALADGDAAGGDLEGTLPNPAVAPQAITAAKLADALRPSRGGGDSEETLRALGSAAGKACAGNDPRLSDQRVPADASVSDAKVASDAAIAESKLALAADARATVPSRRTLGTSATQACAGNDGRLPTTDEKAALVGTSGSAPSAGNPLVDSADVRLWDPGDLRFSFRTTAPDGWYACDGAAKSRSTNGALFDAITERQACAATRGSRTLIVADSSRLAPGWPVEGSGIASGTRIQAIVDATHVTLTVAASGTSSFTARFFPHGNGDGSSTFLLPDHRGRAAIGAGAGSGLTARALGATVGEEGHVLASSEVPATDVTWTDAGGGAYDRVSGTSQAAAYAHWGTGGSGRGLVIGGPDAPINGGSGAFYDGLVVAGGGGAHNTMQPSIAMNIYIKA